MKKQSHIIIIFAAAIVIAGLSCKTTERTQDIPLNPPSSDVTSARGTVSRTIAVITNSAANGQAGLPYYFVITNGELNRRSQFEEAWRGPDGRTLPRRRMGLSETFYVISTDAQYVRGELCDGRTGYGPRFGAQIIPNMNTCVTIASQYFYPAGTIEHGTYSNRSILIATNGFRILEGAQVLQNVRFEPCTIYDVSQSPSGNYWEVYLKTDSGRIDLFLINLSNATYRKLNNLPEGIKLSASFMLANNGEFSMCQSGEEDFSVKMFYYKNNSFISAIVRNTNSDIPFSEVISKETGWARENINVPFNLNDGRYWEYNPVRINYDFYNYYTFNNKSLISNLYKSSIITNKFLIIILQHFTLSPTKQYVLIFSRNKQLLIILKKKNGDYEINSIVRSYMNTLHAYSYQGYFDLSENNICITANERNGVFSVYIYDLNGKLKFYREFNFGQTRYLESDINVVPTEHGLVISILNEVVEYEIN